MKKYKLKCFICGDPFESKEDVFKNHKNYPVCADCLIGFLELTWDYDFTEYVFGEIKTTFNRNYNRWRTWFYKNHTRCDGEHDDYSFYYEVNDNITEIKGKKYCIECIEEMKEIIQY